MSKASKKKLKAELSDLECHVTQMLGDKFEGTCVSCTHIEECTPKRITQRYIALIKHDRKKSECEDYEEDI